MIAAVQASNVTAGLGGFLVLFFLALACWFLYRSMNRHLRNVRYEAGELTSKQRARGERRADGASDDRP
jgi:hypothetical protein